MYVVCEAEVLGTWRFLLSFSRVFLPSPTLALRGSRYPKSIKREG